MPLLSTLWSLKIPLENHSHGIDCIALQLKMLPAVVGDSYIHRPIIWRRIPDPADAPSCLCERAHKTLAKSSIYIQPHSQQTHKPATWIQSTQVKKTDAP